MLELARIIHGDRLELLLGGGLGGGPTGKGDGAF